MLERLCPDDLEDIGDFIGDLCNLCDKNMKQRDMRLPDVCYSLIFLGMDVAIDAGFTPKEVALMCKQILYLIKKRDNL